MFVRDGNKNTRGVGAIASMDAVSPNRRLAEARAARMMARRDAVMALRTLGGTRVAAPKGIVAPPVRRVTSTRSTSTVETGQEAAFSRPSGPVKTKLAQRPKALLVPGIRPEVKPVVKLPGTVIEPPKTTTEPPRQGTTSTGGAALPPPPKPQVNIVVGPGSGTSWTSGTPKPPAPPAPENLPPAWAPEPEVAPTATGKPKTSGNMLLYAGIGIGVLWLLTRK